jgi:hypothetical protein
LEKEREELRAKDVSDAERTATEIALVKKSLEESQRQNQELEDEKSRLESEQ